jgi:hypothetical protein
MAGCVDEPTGLFENDTPGYLAALTGRNGKELRASFASPAEILDGYNNGYLGPGHCFE